MFINALRFDEKHLFIKTSSKQTFALKGYYVTYYVMYEIFSQI